MVHLNIVFSVFLDCFLFVEAHIRVLERTEDCGRYEAVVRTVLFHYFFLGQIGVQTCMDSTRNELTRALCYRHELRYTLKNITYCVYVINIGPLGLILATLNLVRRCQHHSCILNLHLFRISISPDSHKNGIYFYHVLLLI